MVEPLSVNTDGVRSLAEVHTGVAAGLAGLAAGTPGPTGVAGSHGTIAHGVDTALTAALGSRTGTMNITQTSGTQISELLHQAAVAYERGDKRGAEAIRAAADTIARGENRATRDAPGGAPTASGAAGGGDAIGQAVGQMGQLGQLGQQLGAPLAALAQPLQQLPQRGMQGLQQMAQSATQSTASDNAPGAGSDEAREPGAHGETTGDDHETAQPAEQSASGAQPGAEAAPVAPVGQPEPAPTRPAVT